MEIVGSRRANANLHVAIEDLTPDVGGLLPLGEVRIVIHQLKVPFDPCRAVLRPLAVHAMRKQHYEAGRDSPFSFARNNIVINCDLRSVGEVAELSLP